MNYKSAIDSIGCILSACDPDIRERIYSYIDNHKQKFDEKWSDKNGIPTFKEMKAKILAHHAKKNIK
jgi:hypothetical protein